MKILLTSECGKVSAPEVPTLTYDIAVDDSSPKDKNKLYIRLNRNDTGGLFSQEWIAYETIKKTLETVPMPFSSVALKKLFSTSSANNSGYLAAVLRNEDIICSHDNRVRKNITSNPKSFEQRMAKLIKTGKYLPDTLAADKA